MATVNVAINISSNYRGGPGLAKADKDVNKFRKSVGRAANSVRAFQFVLAGVTISTMTIWGKRILDVADSMQLLRIRLSNVEGGLDEGNKKFRELFSTFKNVPFETDKIIDGFVRLRAAGISSAVATETMENLVDAVAAFGGTSSELQRATIGFQQVAGKGVLSMEELRQQIGEAIPGALSVMARAAGVSIAVFVDKVKKGLISSGDSIRFFNEGAKEAFGGFAENLRTTISGATAGLKNTFKEQIDRIFNVDTDLGARVVAFIRVLTKRIEELASSIDQESVNAFWDSFEGVALVVLGVAEAIDFLIGIIFKLIGAIGNALGSVGGQALTFGIIGAIFGTPVTGIIVGSLIAIGGGIQGITNSFKAFLDPIADAWRWWVRVTDKMYEFLGLTKLVSAANKFVGDGLAPPDIFGGQDKDQSKKGGFLAGLDEEVTKVQEEIENIQFKQLKLSILGLSDGAAKLALDIESLGEKSRAAAENVETPWIKAFDATMTKLTAFRKQIGPQREKLEEGFKERQEAINRLLAKGKTKEAAEAQEDLNRQYAEANELLDGMTSRLGGAEAAARKLRDVKSEEAFQKIAKSFRDIRMEADLALGKASPLQAEQAAVNDKVAAYRMELEQNIRILQSIHKEDAGRLATLEALKELLGELGIIETALNQRVRERNALASEALRIQTQQVALEVQSRSEELGRMTSPDFRSDAARQADQARAALQRESLEITQKILDLKLRLTEELNPADEESINRQIESYRILRENVNNAAASMSEAAILHKQMWESVAQTIENSVGNAIEGVVTGTKSLKEAGMDMWRALIRKAAEYIAKLLIMKALGGLSGFMGGGFNPTGVGMFTAAGAANGAAFKGQVTPFADGGLIRGPTMFGLAGEAGTEAIMPLKRINGKLGVATDGRGGDSFSVTVQAIDTQSGAQFLMDNMPTIVQGMQHEASLNRGMRRQV